MRASGVIARAESIKEAIRSWVVLAGLWTVGALLIAFTVVEYLSDFELCVAEWGGCGDAHTSNRPVILGLKVFGLTWAFGAGVLAVLIPLALVARSWYFEFVGDQPLSTSGRRAAGRPLTRSDRGRRPN